MFCVWFTGELSEPSMMCSVELLATDLLAVVATTITRTAEVAVAAEETMKCTK